MRGSVLKCRFVGRDFRFLEEHDNLFAPGSTSTTNRVVDYLALKDNDDPNGPLVTIKLQRMRNSTLIRHLSG